MSVLEGSLVFVDVETTGMSYSRGRVIEVAAIRVEDGQVIDSLSSLVDPGMNLPPFITGLTGITDSDLKHAPSFHDIAAELHAMLQGAVFVAHNVRFDYGFLKHEFRRAGRDFNPKLLCTVRLSKALYPTVRGHKLQDLIDRCDIEVTSRHRAYDDALAMWHFIQHSQAHFPAPKIDDAIAQQLKAPSLPKDLSPDTLSSLPETPGVYTFNDDRGRPLYIGKSVNIRKRVMSHFSADSSSEGEFKITQQVCDVKAIRTGGELEALLLESKMIKDLQPLYNRQLRRRQKLTLARKTVNDGYLTVNIEDVAEIEPDTISDVLGVYSTKGQARDFMGGIVKDFGLCPRLMGLEKSRGACFSYQLKRCSGACAGQEPSAVYNSRLLSAFAGRRLRDWPFESPVIIAEKTDSDRLSSIVIDQWCVIADISQEPECDPVVRFQDKMFDLDTYKILRAYLSSKAHRLNVKPVSLDWVKQLGAGSSVV
ncbi:DNA polymerase III subunit epsilon [Candidatus Saccharibacteria bacterium]|nr:DNA polymerase III subunit epsilon [Candidatus Saccharibacteria bacterium]